MPKTSNKNNSEATNDNNRARKSTTATTTTIELPENSRIVQPSYLEKNSGKKDLVRRLRNLVHVLRDDDDENDAVVEVDSPEWPGLNATAILLATSTYLHHTDKDVRLYTVLACIEILTIYAPDVPWEEHEIIDIFSQLTRQLANLANIIDTDPAIPHYTHILEVLANIRIGCILVDLVNQQSDRPVPTLHDDEEEDDDDGDDDVELLPRKKNLPNVSSMDALVDLLSTLLHSVRRDHPQEILALVPQAIAACLCDYQAQGGIPFPIPIQDVLLKCIGQGPTQFVIVPATSSINNSSSIKNSKDRGKKETPSSAAIKQVEVPNPTYHAAAHVIRSLLNRVAQPISQLLNGLLNGEPFYTDQSSIRCIMAVNTSEMDVDPPDSATKIKSGGRTCATTSAVTAKYQVDWKNDENNEVYTIAYEFHRVAPQILATVVGTIVHGLRSTSTIQRYGVTQFFGQLFAVQNAKYASEYTSCFRDWLNRKNDIVPSIRLCVVQQCMSILQSTTKITGSAPVSNEDTVDGGNQQQFDVALAVTEVLASLLSTDPSLDVRNEAIHLVCDWVYQRPKGSTNTFTNPSKENRLILQMLQAVASRVSSKQKQERRDAVTGLAHIYCKHFIQPNLQPVSAACLSAENNDEDEDGIDEDIVTVSIRALHEMCENIEGGTKPNHRSQGRSNSRSRHSSHEDEGDLSDFESDYNGTDLYRWIPSKVLECVSFTDSTDTEMRSRVVQIIDEFLLKETSPIDKNAKQSSKRVTFATARAIAWTSLLDSLVNDPSGDTNNNIDLMQMTNKIYHRYTSSAYKFLQQLLTHRATLQRHVSRYIDARAQIREYEAGSEEAMEADARAVQLLEQIAKMTSPIENSKVALDDVLASFHGARDKHIFRILATIVDPAHTSEARRRAFDELPKRTKSLGDTVSEWVKNLAKRCAMGDSLNVDVINECVRLAQGCALENDISSCSAFLSSVMMTVDIYPAICTQDVFNKLIQIFLHCRSANGSTKKDIHSSGILTTLSYILSAVTTDKTNILSRDSSGQSHELENQLTRMCTHDGTPEQARTAVHTLAQIFRSADGDSTKYARDEYFVPLLNTLTSTSRWKLSADSNEGLKVVRAMSALAAITDCAPTVLIFSSRGQDFVKFALEGILLGRDITVDNSEAEDDESFTGADLSSQSPSSQKKQRSSHNTRNFTPHFKGSMLEDENLSMSCRRICASADFLATYVRSTHLQHAMQTPAKISEGKIPIPPKSQVRLLFQVLIQILKDQGLPASSRDRKMCTSRQDRAALRQCATISLLRLCDARLGLEQEFLSKAMWHTLGMSLLDDEKTVRIAVMEELSKFYKGSDTYGAYMHLPPKAPSLRFLSYIALCTDGDRDQDAANGHAANVGKVILSTKAAANSCIINLRKVTEATYTHCCAMGKDSEAIFESRIKMLITPEYCLPFAFHLLCHRKEIPIEGATSAVDGSDSEVEGSDEENAAHANDGQMRILRKRLKFLLDSLVHTLGDRANNISFLLRMTEILGRHYTPIGIESVGVSASSPQLRKSIDSNGDEHPSNRITSNNIQLLETRLKTICSVAREILLSFVKSDVNLSTYTGTIQLPASLFKRSDLGVIRFSNIGQDTAVVKPKRRKTQLEYVKTSATSSNLKQKTALKSPLHQAPGSSASKSDIRVTFSPVVQFQSGKTKNIAFFDSSPIPKSNTPESGPGSSGRRSTRSASIGSATSRSADTLGATPPADLRTGTAVDDLETSDEDVFASTKRHRSSGSESSTFSDHRRKAKESTLLQSNSATSSSEPTATITQTQSTESSEKLDSSQSSNSDKSSFSMPQKRRARSNDKNIPTKVKRDVKAVVRGTEQKKVTKKIKDIKPDELDFAFDEENDPIERNHGKSDKRSKRKTTSKTLPAKSKSNTRTTQLLASRRR